MDDVTNHGTGVDQSERNNQIKELTNILSTYSNKQLLEATPNHEITRILTKHRSPSNGIGTNDRRRRNRDWFVRSVEAAGSDQKKAGGVHRSNSRRKRGKQPIVNIVSYGGDEEDEDADDDDGNGRVEEIIEYDDTPQQAPRPHKKRVGFQAPRKQHKQKAPIFELPPELIDAMYEARKTKKKKKKNRRPTIQLIEVEKKVEAPPAPAAGAAPPAPGAEAPPAPGGAAAPAKAAAAAPAAGAAAAPAAGAAAAPAAGAAAPAAGAAAPAAAAAPPKLNVA